MQILSVLADPILPVFAILALGYALGRAGRISTDDARLINRFAMTVLLSILVFGLVANAPFASFRLAPVLAYVGAETVVATAGFALARAFGRAPREAVLLGAGAIFSNNAFYVLPISIFLYGPDNILPITTIITLDAVLAFSLIMFALQMTGEGPVRPARALAALARTPLFQAIALGLAVNASGVTLPQAAQTFIAFNAAAAAPVALFALGAILSAERLAVDRVIVTFSALKLLVFPALVWALLQLGSALPENRLFVMGAAGPASTAVMGLGILYNVRIDALGPILIWTCLFSLVSLAVLA
ncbi:MAG: AEC family transporter [Rhodobacteraceae bacterium]|nr:AEC family transporter [Paracoccaceae bacterium]